MKKFIQDNQVWVIGGAILGLVAFMLAGIELHVMIGMAEAGSKQIIEMAILVAIGITVTVLPLSILYDIITENAQEASDLRYDLRNARRGQADLPRPSIRRGESEHWSTNDVGDDDIDGDGQGDDSLRRLGVLR